MSSEPRRMTFRNAKDLPAEISKQTPTGPVEDFTRCWECDKPLPDERLAISPLCVACEGAYDE